MQLLSLISEEIEKFVKEYFDDDEQTTLDRYHEKRGISSIPTTEKPFSGEFVGNVLYSWGVPLKQPIAIHKNPSDLKNYSSNIKGILLNNGDVFFATSPQALHDDILLLLERKGIIPKGIISNWYRNYPDEFVAIQRLGFTNIFGGAATYSTFPNVPEKYFPYLKNASSKHPYDFKFR